MEYEVRIGKKTLKMLEKAPISVQDKMKVLALD